MKIYVDVRSVLSLIGTLLRWFSLTLFVPIITAFVYGEPISSFLITMALSFGIGWGLDYLQSEPDLTPRDAFLMVSLSWLAVALLGSVPYILEGHGTIAQPFNALFESMSGFTTTGSTVMGTISTSVHGHGILMWRQLTQWLGGMGIIVLAVAILPRLSVGGAQLIQQEAPGPKLEKLTPRIAQTARRLWLLYFLFSLSQISVLYGLYSIGWAPKMDVFHSVAHTFTTLPTGGFSPEARSIEAFSPAVQWAIIFYMIVAGTNFALLWFALTGKFQKLFEDREYQFYLCIISIFSGLGFILIAGTTSMSSSLEETIRESLFQFTSIITTTGYANLDFNEWNVTLKMFLVFAMFAGACTGSTGGSIKIVRWLVMLKSVTRELFVSIRSAAVRPVRLGKNVIQEDTLRGILMFLFLYFLLFSAGAGVIAIDCQVNGIELSFLEAISASATTIGNVGPAIGMAGPMENFLAFPPVSRGAMILLMWLGRLEIVTVLVIFTPYYWKT